MNDSLRLQFDVAYALAVLGSSDRLQLPFPEKLELTENAKKILSDCVDPNSYEASSCRIRNELPDGYNLGMGDHTLKLFECGQIHAGGSGVTVELHDPALKRHYALKVPRASLLAYVSGGVNRLTDEKLFEHLRTELRAFENEKTISRRLSHQNVARYVFGDRKRIPDLIEPIAAEFPYSISEWIDGARPLHKYLIEEAPSVKELIGLISNTFSALSHIHAQEVLHWDIKSHNILISIDNIVKIIDFGNAKLLDVPTDDDLVATTSKGKYPSVPTFREIATPNSESRRFSILLPDRSWNHAAIDLWMLAQEWNRCLDISNAFAEGDPDLDEQQKASLRTAILERQSYRPLDAFECLRIIIERILCTFNERHVAKCIRSDRSFDPTQLYYNSAIEVSNEISRILPVFGAAQEVPELLVSLDEIIRLPVTGNSVFTDRVAAVVETKVVQPTKLHYQLGQVREVFPGATHTRFEHLLGTVTTTAFFIRSLYLNEINSFWRVSAEADDATAVILAAILHDTGHLAFGHFIEEMDDLLGPWTHDRYVIALLAACRRKATMGAAPPPLATDRNERDTGFELPSEEVEELIMVLERYFCDDRLNRSEKLGHVVQLLDRVTAIFEAEWPDAGITAAYLSRNGTRRALDCILRSIVDGPIDADKLDYLRRDSFHSGVFFADGIDLERFFESLRVCVGTTEREVSSSPAVGVSEKGIAPIETIITARYHLYSVVYWHRTVRCITAMLQRVISEIRLVLSDTAWDEFLSALLVKFRKLNDQQALEWLQSDLEERGILNNPIGRSGRSARDQVKLADLIDALLGDRKKYFRMAFELRYIGPIDPDDTIRGKTATESVHDQICAAIHPDRGDAPTDPSAWSVYGRTVREELKQFRLDLEHRFLEKVNQHVSEDFVLDTILLDVPEPGKDQIHPLQVDQRSKRSVTRVLRPRDDQTSDTKDYVDVVLVSPIAASLADVFSRWARKVRIYMTRRDLENLGKYGLEFGDVAAIWQHVLYELYNVSADQPTLRF